MRNQFRASLIKIRLLSFKQIRKRNVDIVSDVTFNYKLVVLLATSIEITILDKFVDLVIYISDLHICYPFFFEGYIFVILV
jgi:hypothetical protein